MRLIFLLAAALFVSGCRIHNWSGYASGSNIADWTGHATETRNFELPIASGGKLIAEVPYGAMTVRVVPGCTPTLRARIDIRGRTSREVDEARQGFSITVDAAGPDARVHTASTGIKEGHASIRADLEFDLPADCALELKSSSGEIRAEPGPFGPCRLASSYGAVRASDVNGGLVASSGSGSVRAERLRGGRIELTSRYGPIEIADAEGESVVLSTGSGSIDAGNVKAARLKADSRYGPVTVRAVEAQIEASSGSGKVSGIDLNGSSIQLTSRYGPVDLRRARGSFALKTGSGDVTAREVEGALSAETTYGTVALDGVFPALSGESGSGSVSAVARPGSRVESPWSLVSRYGAVDLSAPADLGFELSARTSYGNIQLGYPLQLAPGEFGKGQQMSGAVNGGGPRVTLESRNGSVRIAPLPAAAVPAGADKP